MHKGKYVGFELKGKKFLQRNRKEFLKNQTDILELKCTVLFSAVAITIITSFLA
jgi:hypothetical protein